MKKPHLKIVLKPWGREIWFAQTKHYVGKFLLIKKGHRLSLQYHRFKTETLYTDKGRYLLELNGTKRLMATGSVVTFLPKMVHRMYAKFGDVRIVEISTPQVRDVVRLQDDYGRGQSKLIASERK